ncbi:MAG: endopeptidase La [Pseudomonadota bacterium]
MNDEPLSLPLLPLRDMVVYPHGVHPLFVGTKRSIAALEGAMAGDKQILLVAKRDSEVEQPELGDLYTTGTVATVLQLLKLPDDTVKVLVEGVRRARIEALEDAGSYAVASVQAFDEPETDAAQADLGVRTLMNQFERYVQGSKKVPAEVVASLSSIDDPARLADTIAAQMSLPLEERQTVLEAVVLKQRIEVVLDLIDTQIEVQQMERAIRSRVKKQMERSQREYYLNEQLKAIQNELGGGDEEGDEASRLKAKIDDAGLSKEAHEKAMTELGKLKQMAPMSAEATVVRSYLDWMTSLPWKDKSRVRRDLPQAQKILDEDHYGLEEVKERIIEYLAVQSRVKKVKGSVLCLVGPPGVGKTSLGKSIARATNRKFVRMALGGVRDEAEIRGHRRTYIGSMPGKVLQKLANVETRNPLFLLDEIDKMGMDFRGDPASALLEVLDPEQNSSFNDHYLEVDFDLSDVFFICTSNSMNIPAPLLDRMEVIRLPGYTEIEKEAIARRYLIPKQRKVAGLKEREFDLDDDALLPIIRYYTREAGVRELERQIAKLARKRVTALALGQADTVPAKLDAAAVEEALGVRRYSYGLAEEQNQVGMVTGLAWTQAGGELLNIEALAVPGKGRQTKTGSLGDVMQESIQAATTFVRSRANSYGIDEDFHEKLDLHVHVPEGATPKDGPSAGIGMCTALVSVLTGIPVRADVAMTGEVTLRGQVLKIGGLKEKLLAASRGGIKRVLIPSENERDLKEVPDEILADLEIHPVAWMDQALELALERSPTLAAEGVADAVVSSAARSEERPRSAH